MKEWREKEIKKEMKTPWKDKGTKELTTDRKHKETKTEQNKDGENAQHTHMNTKITIQRTTENNTTSKQLRNNANIQ